MKKSIIALFLLFIILFAAGCKKKILHCDSCNAEISVKESSNMEEDWIIYCAECNEELFGNDPLLNPEK